MTRKEQDENWAKLSLEGQHDMWQRYESAKDLIEIMNEEYGEHNLDYKPKLTYEDVAKELFEDGYYYYDYVYNRIVENSCTPTMPMACTSQNQVRKLCAINQLLNVAKFLNKNEDGSDWVPDWEKATEKKWYPYLRDDEIHISFITREKVTPVVFRTNEIVQQAIEILGEETIRTALGNY